MDTPDPQLARVKALFNEVCDLADEAARRARLSALEAEPELVERVLALARGADHPVTHFSKPVAGLLSSVVDAAGDGTAELAVGDRLGVWMLVGTLGQGGMGQVFLAERDDGLYQQKAAVKLLRGRGSPESLAQLARERQILARLDHPHIARLIDGGTTPRGRPFLVMDYVQGQAIDTWCRERSLGLDAVLALFGQVCEAVAYAHGQFVLHCDIKPGNVLVGSDGRARLLDFGIARLQGEGEHDMVALTPRYASPEQKAGLPASVASDVYSLGRMLDELLQAITPAPARRVEWQALVAKATAAEVPERYANVAELQADLRRFGQHRPLQALHSRGQAYRAAKLWRRQWPWVLAGLGALALSTAFVLRLVQERDRALQAEAAAQREGETAGQVSRLLVALFEGADPQVSGRADVSAAELVEKGRKRLDQDLQGQPAVRARMKGVLAQVYDNLGQSETAVTLFEQALALERQLPQRNHVAEALLMADQARLQNGVATYLKAQALAREAVALLKGRVAEDSIEMAAAVGTLGLTLSPTSATFDEARPLLERALQIRLQRQGPDHLDVAQAHNDLGYACMASRRDDMLPVAQDHLERAVAILGRHLGPQHPRLLRAKESLALVYGFRQRRLEAVTLLEEVVAQHRALLGPENAQLSAPLLALAGVRHDAGQTPAAIADYRESLRLAEKAHGRQSALVALGLNRLADPLAVIGDPEAEQHLREALAIRSKLVPAGDVTIARLQHNLGRWLLREGRIDEALPLLAQSRATRIAKLPPTHDERIEAQLTDAELGLAQRQWPPAEAALADVAQQEAGMRVQRRSALRRLQGLLAQAQGRPQDAVPLLLAARDLAQQTHASGHAGMLRAQLELAEAQAAAGQQDAARQTLQDARGSIAVHSPASRLRLRAEQLQARLRA